MSKRLKVLVNGITLDDANLVPLIKKINYWHSKRTEVIILGSSLLASKLRNQVKVSYLNLGPILPMRGGLLFITSSISRNLKAILKLSFIPPVEVVYSISSVMDLIILPYILKKIGRAERWVTVFDNTVPLFSNGKIISGNPFIRALAWGFYKMSLLLLRSADSIFVVKKELKDYLIRRGFDGKKLIVTGNGVERDLILKAKSRKKYHIDALFVGRINEAKGIYDLLEVLNLVIKKFPKFQLALVGNGDPKAIKQFKAKVKQMKLKNNVQMMGFKTGQEKYDIIKSCKIFLFLSQTESLPVAPMEAVCTGKKVIVYKLDAYKMYKNNEILMLEQGDYHSVAAEVLKIFKEQTFHNQAGPMLLAKYDWDAIARKEYTHFTPH